MQGPELGTDTAGPHRCCSEASAHGQVGEKGETLQGLSPSHPSYCLGYTRQAQRNVVPIASPQETDLNSDHLSDLRVEHGLRTLLQG